jgi:hypothetical protein
MQQGATGLSTERDQTCGTAHLHRATSASWRAGFWEARPSKESSYSAFELLGALLPSASALGALSFLIKQLLMCSFLICSLLRRSLLSYSLLRSNCSCRLPCGQQVQFLRQSRCGLFPRHVRIHCQPRSLNGAVPSSIEQHAALHA